MTASLLDNLPTPPAAELLGWHLIDHDATRGWIKVGFDGKPEFLNPAGYIQGGLLAAMLDDCMGPAALLASGGKLLTVTVSLTVNYLAPARPGRYIGEGEVIKMGKSVAHLEARLSDANGEPIARATSAARLMPLGPGGGG